MDKEDFFDTMVKMLKLLQETDTDSFEWLLDHVEVDNEDDREQIREML